VECVAGAVVVVDRESVQVQEEDPFGRDGCVGREGAAPVSVGLHFVLRMCGKVDRVLCSLEKLGEVAWIHFLALKKDFVDIDIAIGINIREGRCPFLLLPSHSKTTAVISCSKIGRPL